MGKPRTCLCERYKRVWCMFIIYIVHHEDLPPWKLTCQLKKGPFQKGSDSLPSIIFQGICLFSGTFRVFLDYCTIHLIVAGVEVKVFWQWRIWPRVCLVCDRSFQKTTLHWKWSVSFCFFLNLGSVYPLISSIFVDGWVMMVSYFKSKCLEAFGKGLGSFREGIHFESGSWGMFLCYLRYIKDVCIYEFVSFFQNICKLIL